MNAEREIFSLIASAALVAAATTSIGGMMQLARAQVPGQTIYCFESVDPTLQSGETHHSYCATTLAYCEYLHSNWPGVLSPCHPVSVHRP